MEYEVRERLSSSQIDELEILYEDLWAAEKRQRSDIEKMLKGSDLIVAMVHGEELIGFARVLTDGVYKAFIYDVVIKREYRKRGLGKALINEVLNNELLMNVEHIELYCPEKYGDFYEELGFVKRETPLYRI